MKVRISRLGYPNYEYVVKERIFPFFWKKVFTGSSKEVNEFFIEHYSIEIDIEKLRKNYD